MSQHPLRYYLYTRKSTDDKKNRKQILSIESQFAELREFAKTQKLFIVQEIEEHRTARSPGRPLFNQMMQNIAKGKADGILAWHPDRLARNSKDGGEVIHQLDQGTLKDLKFPAYTFENTPTGKFVLYMTFAQSKLYVDNMSVNTSRNHRQKIRRGEWPFRAPIGYLHNTKKRTIYLDPRIGPIITRAFELYATGSHAIVDIKTFLNDAGVRSPCAKRPISNSHCQNILTNPFYYGLMKFKGELHPGIHSTLISKSLFDRVQEQMTRRSKPNSPRLKPSLYRGMFRCGECGCIVTMETQKGINYLRCTKRKSSCSQPYLRETTLHEQLHQELHKLVFPRAALALLREVLDEKSSEIRAENESQAAVFKQKRTGIEQRSERLLDLLEAETISPEQYRIRANRCAEEIASIDEKARITDAHAQHRFEPWTDLENRLNEATVLDKLENPEKIRDFLKNTGSNFVIEARRSIVTLKNRWQIVADWKTRHLPTWPNLSRQARISTLCTLLAAVRPQQNDQPAETMGFESQSAGEVD